MDGTKMLVSLMGAARAEPNGATMKAMTKATASPKMDRVMWFPPTPDSSRRQSPRVVGVLLMGIVPGIPPLFVNLVK
ncbi:hypothetical protein CL654_00010 [bacterium]|nr:hypothetical protein [bacterium]